MKILTGTDIIEIERVRNSIENIGEKFIREVFTEKEIEYCEGRGQAKFQHYAARFAAKEAIFKAVSKLLNNKYELTWNNAEVLNDENGKPYINFIDTNIGDRIEDIDISISHCKKYAVSNVVLVLK